MYSMLDSGDGRKLEQFGDYCFDRPCASAVWAPSNRKMWSKSDAHFTREPAHLWRGRERIPEEWQVEVEGLRFRLQTTDFGHLGIFPEQAMMWRWLQQQGAPGVRALNLFAYSGGSTLAMAKAGCDVCHLDASQGMVAWARQNAELNDLQDTPIRWIVDDATKFLQREIRRGRQYDAIVLDPPSFGRGKNGEIFKIEEHLLPLLDLCKQLLSDSPKFFLFSCHTPGYTPIVMQYLLEDLLGELGGTIEAGEMLLEGDRPVPSGTYARWSA